MRLNGRHHIPKAVERQPISEQHRLVNIKRSAVNVFGNRVELSNVSDESIRFLSSRKGPLIRHSKLTAQSVFSGTRHALSIRGQLADVLAQAPPAASKHF